MTTWKLINEKTGEPVVFGESYPDFRGDLEIIVGGIPPHKPGSTGRVETKGGRLYFPTVFNLKWVQ
jgi:hypothetical protein